MEIAVLNRPTVHERLLWSKRFRVSTVPLGPTAAVTPSPIPAVRLYRRSAHYAQRRLKADVVGANGVFGSFAQDTPVRRRVSCGPLTAMTMTPHHFTISAKNVEHHKSRSPAMRNVYDAFICGVFRYPADPADQLTVFPGAGIAGIFLPSEIPSKSFA
jgi:hypothetical protein